MKNNILECIKGTVYCDTIFITGYNDGSGLGNLYQRNF